MQKTFSQHCENNKVFIKQVLLTAFKPCQNILEIGSGTGQHAIFFSEQMPHLTWHTSDQLAYIDNLTKNITASKLKNIRLPIVLDVTSDWPFSKELHLIDGIFTANSLHIMSEEMVKDFFKGIGALLPKNGQLCIYGPFNYNGEFTSESNAAFDLRLKENNKLSGIRDFEWIVLLAKQQNLVLRKDVEMPANNRLLHFTMH
jgi:cyclopropane fatty-acyl-phospholipid synthase-like methyltransferase